MYILPQSVRYLLGEKNHFKRGGGGTIFWENIYICTCFERIYFDGKVSGHHWFQNIYIFQMLQVYFINDNINII